MEIRLKADRQTAIKEILPDIMLNICQRADRRLLKKRHFTNRVRNFRFKKLVNGFAELRRINEPFTGRCFDMAGQFCRPVFGVSFRVVGKNDYDTE